MHDFDKFFSNESDSIQTNVWLRYCHIIRYKSDIQSLFLGYRTASFFGIFTTFKIFSIFSKDYISGCGAFSLNSQSVSFLPAYLLSELISSALLAETGGKCPLVFSVTCVGISYLLLIFDNVLREIIQIEHTKGKKEIRHF